MTRTLCFDLHTFWHAGSGRGDGSADAVVHRTAEELPFLPGRTVKGLVREAAELSVAAGLLPPDEVLRLFGSRLPPQVTPDDRVRHLEEARYASRAGVLRFDSARLGRTKSEQTVWREWALGEPAARQHLYNSFASTRIDEDGIAQDQTLRTIELVVPARLYAFVEGPEDTPWDVLGEAVRLFIRGVGSHRFRGLGRVSVGLEKGQI